MGSGSSTSQSLVIELLGEDGEGLDGPLKWIAEASTCSHYFAKLCWTELRCNRKVSQS